jgi:hypothetical protein
LHSVDFLASQKHDDSRRDEGRSEDLSKQCPVYLRCYLGSDDRAGGRGDGKPQSKP